MTTRVPVPRDRDNDYTREAADARRAFVRERTGVDLEQVAPLRRLSANHPYPLGSLERSRA